MIYPMKPEEYDGIYQLWRSCSGMGLNDLDDSREGMEAFLKRNPTTCFSAWEDGKIVGSILCGHDGRRGYLYHTAVLPDYRGRGIGTELVQAALKGLEEAGIHKAALDEIRRETPSGSVRGSPCGRTRHTGTKPCGK